MNMDLGKASSFLSQKSRHFTQASYCGVRLLKMDIIQILGAVGFGVVVTKILDIVWLQKVVRDSERRKWLREERLKAYSELAEEVLTLGLHNKSYKSAFSGYVIASRSILLTESDELAIQIRVFMNKVSKLYAEGTKDDEDPDKLSLEELEQVYKHVMDESKELIVKLRNELVK